MTFYHTPVLLNEVLSFIPKKAHCIIDFTLGGANHADAMLAKCDGACLFGIDRDIAAIKAGKKRLESYGNRTELIHGAISTAINELKTKETQADFILADLGVSSNQLQQVERGFSFRRNGPLDMRMNTDDKESAADVVNRYDELELGRIIGKFGEERFSRQIAKNIIRQRQIKSFSTTHELAECVLKSIPKKYQFGKIHPATRTFQAIRIQVNKEIYEVEILLNNALDLLTSNGRLAIISFHSLEDRPVKQRFKQWEDPCTCPKDLPVCVCGKKPLVKILTRKAIKAGPEEMKSNIRSRSARLRIVEKI